MIPGDKAEFGKVVLAFAELKGKQLSLAAVELYWSAMQHWPIDAFKAAANHLLLNGNDFMPQPHHFEELRKAGRLQAAEAWIKARQNIQWGLHGATLSDDCPPLIARAINAIGGPNVVWMTDEDKLPFLERRFVEHYETLQDATDTREALPQLTLDALDITPRLAADLKRLVSSQAVARP